MRIASPLTFSRRGFLAGAAAILALPQGAAFAASRLKAATTFTIIADMAANVAGEAADVFSITEPARRSTAISRRPAIL